jgi:ABC-type branched-subunit amino acid transport system substrate-binding protein
MPQKSYDAARAGKIALLVPLTGQHHALGQSLQKAAELSLFDQGDDQLNLVIYDTKSTVEGTEKAAIKALQEQAGLILGPVFADHVQAIVPLARRASVNVVSFSNNKAIAGAGVFVLGFSPEEQVRAILSYAHSHGKNTIAILIPRNAYGMLVEREVKAIQATQQDMKIEIISYSGELADMAKDLNPLRTLQMDALFIPEGGQALLRLISSLLYHEIPLEKVQLLGTGQWDDELIYQNISLQGAWIAAPDPQERASFITKYRQAYSQDPERIATLAYDAVAMLAVLKRHHPLQAYSFSALTQPRGFDGIDGIFRLRVDGITERKPAIAEITATGLRVLRVTGKRF